MKKIIIFLSILLFSSNLMAQKKSQSELQVNSQYHDIIMQYLQQDVQKRQKQMSKQARQILINLPNDEKLYDESFVDIKAEVTEGTKEDGSNEINFSLEISYNCRNFEGYTDDYPIATYNYEQSNTSRAICNLAKTLVEGTCSDLFAPNLDVTVDIFATTDATQTAYINYAGEYGDFRYCPAIYNGESVRISVSQEQGITTNAQLAYIRAQSVRDYLEKNISNLKKTNNEFRYITKSYNDTGSLFRRASVKLEVHGAFDKKVEEMSSKMIQDEFVDYNIPLVEPNSNNETFMLIIANEDYNILPSVPFASNDGNMMKQYGVKTLGIPERHIKVISNASAQAIHQQGINWLKDITVAMNGQANIIVYYAGHGTSDADYNPYIIPTGINFEQYKSLSGDIGHADIELSKREARKLLKECISLDTLVAWFNRVQNKSITFIIDASFNGVQRNGQPFFTINKTAKRPRGLRIRGDIVVFSAAAADKTAFAFEDQHHGFLTYFLLKELKRTKGNTTYQELFDNIASSLSYESSLQGKLQQPVLTAGGKVKEAWKAWSFR